MADPKVAQEIVRVTYPTSSIKEISAQLQPLSANLEKAIASKLTTQESIEAANGVLRVGEDWIRRADEVMDPVIEAAHKSHKASLEAARTLKGTIPGLVAKLKSVISNVIYENRRKAEQEQRDRDAAQSKINREAADVAAKKAREQGADKEAVKEIKQAVMATPAPMVAPKIEAPEGMIMRLTWKCDRVEDQEKIISKIVAAISAGDNQAVSMLEINWSFCDAMTRAGRELSVKRMAKYGIVVKAQPSGVSR